MEQIIFNDPIYGFIHIESNLILDIINHKYFQRLRRIKQLGLTYLVYPGALHNRFQHVIGAVHLMQKALTVLRSKNIEISDEEYEATCIAILLHDIGHNPFSHALEGLFVEGAHHEEISILIMERLNEIFKGKLELAIRIFKDEYEKPFLHQLISSQLDTDRLDYLKRDTFYTAVAEGGIGVERIIRTMNVVDGQLVNEEKGLYSITSYLNARSVMYSQVYLHKTVLSAEQILSRIVIRAKQLKREGNELFLTAGLKYFFDEKIDLKRIQEDDQALQMFVSLDDDDLLTCMKEWCNNDDLILSHLCKAIVYRRLYKVEVSSDPIPEDKINAIRQSASRYFNQSIDIVERLVFTGETINKGYNMEREKINILERNDQVTDIAGFSSHFNIASLSNPVKKYYICYPKELAED